MAIALSSMDKKRSLSPVVASPPRSKGYAQLHLGEVTIGAWMPDFHLPVAPDHHAALHAAT